MNEHEAGAILARWHRAAPQGQKTVAVLLFGLAYTDALEDMNVAEVARRAEREIDTRYGAVVRSAIALSRYVTLDELPPWAHPRPPRPQWPSWASRPPR